MPRLYGYRTSKFVAEDWVPGEGETLVDLEMYAQERGATVEQAIEQHRLWLELWLERCALRAAMCAKMFHPSTAQSVKGWFAADGTPQTFPACWVDHKTKLPMCQRFLEMASVVTRSDERPRLVVIDHKL